MDLDSMKYFELQALAKTAGLKANVKAEKLLKALKQHYNNKDVKEEREQNNQNNAGNDGENSTQSVHRENSTTKRVTAQKAVGNRSKRKVSDAATLDSKVSSDAAEAPSESVRRERFNDAKRRKLSDKDKPTEELHTTEKEQQQVDDEPKASVTNQTEKKTAGKIPRLQKGKLLLKPVTPNFKKLHEAQFNKMESIDSFFQRRTKQLDTCKNSKEVKKTSRGRTSLFSPVAVNKTAAEAPPKRQTRKTEVPFRPSVLSTRRINVWFSESTVENEHKRSLIKTPARISSNMGSSTPKRSAAAATLKALQASAQSSRKTPEPFLFTGNNTSMSATPGTQKKQSFDLKASLSRPLNYKPHTGKLKPFGEVENSVAPNQRQDCYKNHKVQSREDRRTKIVEGRKNKKDNLLGTRRGLM